MNKKYLQWILALACVGVAISLYTLSLKYGATTGSICNINETFSCDIVNQSQYSLFFGVPVSLLGIIGYLFMGVAALMKIRQPSDKSLSKFLVVSSFGALLFSLYLTSIEAFVLHAWCILCVASQLTILAMAFLVAMVFKNEKKNAHH
jgi:vitamin-K-epoxide reductase (warfarin-sensitive)